MSFQNNIKKLSSDMDDRGSLVPKRFPKIGQVAGVELAAASAGIRHKGRKDVMLVKLARKTTVAGVFTKSRMVSAPVIWSKERLYLGYARALLVNSGNANAFTGVAGTYAVKKVGEALAKEIGCRSAEIFMGSTGVIGEPLPYERILRVLKSLRNKLSSKSWRSAADAIRTTDTFAKASSETAFIDGKSYTISGIAKGSGMIAPDMATMLAFIFTDAKIPNDVLQDLITSANQTSFNAISIDGDTSTSDMALLFATGKGPPHAKISSQADPRIAEFRQKLGIVMEDLAQQIVRDGEGASKFVIIQVTGAESARAARNIGFSIANSPLFKTAVAGEDPNWGRIVMAVGKAGERADRDHLKIVIGGCLVTESGAVSPSYDEELVASHMKGNVIDVHVDVGIGHGYFTVWTCDLTKDYVSINADYRS